MIRPLTLLSALLTASALTLATCATAHASGAPVPDELLWLLFTPAGWGAIGIVVVVLIALIVRAARRD